MGKVLRFQKQIPGSWEDAMQSFLSWKQAQGLSKRTLEDYQYHIGLFFRRYPDAYNPDDLRPSLFKHMAQQVKPGTYNLRLEYLKPFFEWCIREGVFTFNPLVGFRKKKAEARIVSILGYCRRFA